MRCAPRLIRAPVSNLGLGKKCVSLKDHRPNIRHASLSGQRYWIILHWEGGDGIRSVVPPGTRRRVKIKYFRSVFPSQRFALYCKLAPLSLALNISHTHTHALMHTHTHAPFQISQLPVYHCIPGTKVNIISHVLASRLTLPEGRCATTGLIT